MLYKKLYNLFLAMLDVYFYRARPLAYPVKVHIELNDYCNLRCRMCGRQSDFIPKNTGEISLDLIKKISPLFERAIYVGIAGNGEPFLHSKIFEILEFIIQHGATPAVITNATLLDTNISQRLVKLGPLLIQASIDSAVPKIYENIRRGASFEKVRQNLINLKLIKKNYNSNFPVVALISCLMKETIPDIEKLVDFAYEIGAAEIIFQNILPYSSEMDNSLINSFDEGESAFEKARKHASNYGININYAPMGFGIDRLKNNTATANQNGYFCQNIWDLFHIELSGKVRYCCFWSGEKLGDITKENPLKLWRSEKFQNIREDLKHRRMPEYCKNCCLLSYYDKNKSAKNLFNLAKEVIKNYKYFVK